jgi:DNA-binding response OmpR family regulator
MKVLVVAEARWVRDQVRAALVAPGQEVIEVTRGQDVRGAVAEHEPDLVVLDLQIGNMGGIAVAIDLHLEESGGRLPHVQILLLLDREADRFLAKRAAAEAVLVKPVDPGTLRRTVRRLVGGDDRAAAFRQASAESTDLQ